MTDLVSMQIAVVLHEFSNRVVKLVKMFLFKFLKINLNTIPETIVFSVCGCVFIKLVYCILVQNVMISCLNVYAIVKKDF